MVSHNKIFSIGLIGLLVLSIIFVSGCTSEVEEEQISVEEIKSKALTISYDNLMRNNEYYIGKIIYYRGKVVQVSDVYGDKYVLRVATKADPHIGYFEDIIWVNYKGSRLLEDDIIEVWGRVKGLKTYETILGNRITIPEIDSLHLELLEKVE